MILYSYYRSTSAYRVRIALELKGLPYTVEPINLLKGAEQHRSAEYLRINPQGRVPTLVDKHTKILQSPAIIEYLEEAYPAIPLLSDDIAERALARSIASIIGCDIHPLHNVSVLNRLRDAGYDDGLIQQWINHWIADGLRVVEGLIGDSAWVLGPQPGLADVYLLPQIYAARRFGLEIETNFPRIFRVEQLAAMHPGFQRAHPANQIDTKPINKS